MEILILAEPGILYITSLMNGAIAARVRWRTLTQVHTEKHTGGVIVRYASASRNLPALQDSKRFYDMVLKGQVAAILPEDL